MNQKQQSNSQQIRQAEEMLVLDKTDQATSNIFQKQWDQHIRRNHNKSSEILQQNPLSFGRKQYKQFSESKNSIDQLYFPIKNNNHNLQQISQGLQGNINKQTAIKPIQKSQSDQSMLLDSENSSITSPQTIQSHKQGLNISQTQSINQLNSPKFAYKNLSGMQSINFTLTDEAASQQKSSLQFSDSSIIPKIKLMTSKQMQEQISNPAMRKSSMPEYDSQEGCITNAAYKNLDQSQIQANNQRKMEFGANYQKDEDDYGQFNTEMSVEDENNGKENKQKKINPFDLILNPSLSMSQQLQTFENSSQTKQSQIPKHQYNNNIQIIPEIINSKHFHIHKAHSMGVHIHAHDIVDYTDDIQPIQETPEQQQDQRSSKLIFSPNKLYQIIQHMPDMKIPKIHGPLTGIDIKVSDQNPIYGQQIPTIRKSRSLLTNSPQRPQSRILKISLPNVHYWDNEDQPDLDHSTINSLQQLFQRPNLLTKNNSNPMKDCEQAHKKGEERQELLENWRKSPFSKIKKQEEKISKIDLSNKNKTDSQQDQPLQIQIEKQIKNAQKDNQKLTNSNIINNPNKIKNGPLNRKIPSNDQSRQLPPGSSVETCVTPFKLFSSSLKATKTQLKLQERCLIAEVNDQQQRSLNSKQIKIQQSRHVNDPDLDYKQLDEQFQQQLLSLQQLSSKHNQQQQSNFTYNSDVSHIIIQQSEQYSHPRNLYTTQFAITQPIATESDKHDDQIINWMPKYQQYKLQKIQKQPILTSTQPDQLFEREYDGIKYNDSFNKIITISTCPPETDQNNMNTEYSNDMYKSITHDNKEYISNKRSKIKVFIKTKHQPKPNNMITHHSQHPNNKNSPPANPVEGTNCKNEPLFVSMMDPSIINENSNKQMATVMYNLNTQQSEEDGQPGTSAHNYHTVPANYIHENSPNKNPKREQAQQKKYQAQYSPISHYENKDNNYNTHSNYDTVNPQYYSSINNNNQYYSTNNHTQLYKENGKYNYSFIPTRLSIHNNNFMYDFNHISNKNSQLFNHYNKEEQDQKIKIIYKDKSSTKTNKNVLENDKRMINVKNYIKLNNNSKIANSNSLSPKNSITKPVNLSNKIHKISPLQMHKLANCKPLIRTSRSKQKRNENASPIARINNSPRSRSRSNSSRIFTVNSTVRDKIHKKPGISKWNDNLEDLKKAHTARNSKSIKSSQKKITQFCATSRKIEEMSPTSRMSTPSSILNLQPQSTQLYRNNMEYNPSRKRQVNLHQMTGYV